MVSHRPVGHPRGDHQGRLAQHTNHLLRGALADLAPGANSFTTVPRCSRRARSGVGARSHRVTNKAPQSPDRLPASCHIAGK